MVFAVVLRLLFGSKRTLMSADLLLDIMRIPVPSFFWDMLMDRGFPPWGVSGEVADSYVCGAYGEYLDSYFDDLSSS